MKHNVAIVTDSNSGMTKEEGELLDVQIIPMPILINGKEFLAGRDITLEEFFVLQRDDQNDITTSQPNVGMIASMWIELLKKYDSIVYIPMSSGLSSSCQTAMLMAKEIKGEIYVVNNHRISVTMYQSILDAVALRDRGYSAKEIMEQLNADAYQSSIYIMVDTLKYLVKGGRVTPSAAKLGSLLQIKPVLQIQGGALDTYEKCRGEHKAKRVMIQAMKEDMENRFIELVKKGEMTLWYSYCGVEKDKLEEWVKMIEEAFPDFEVKGRELTISIATHIGPGALAIACAHKL